MHRSSTPDAHPDLEVSSAAAEAHLGALIAAERQEPGLSPPDVERLWANVEAAAAAPALGRSAASPRSAMKVTRGLLLAGVVAAGLAGWRSHTATPVPRVEPPSVAHAPSGRPTTPVRLAEVAVPEDVPPRPAASGTPTGSRRLQAKRSAAPRTEGLDAELILLRRARAANSAGQPARALEALAEHKRRFPQGVLRPERRAEQALAWCQQGRWDLADAALDELRRHWPRAPHTRRAVTACARTRGGTNAAKR